MGVKSLRLGLVQQRAAPEAFDEVGVGDEELAESHGVGFAACERGFSAFACIALVDDINAAEFFLRYGPSASGP
jgi:hypothetical protein